MIDVDIIERSLKKIPDYNPELAKTIPSSNKTNFLIASVSGIGLGIFLMLSSQSVVKFLGGSLAAGGLGTSVYVLQRKTDDSTEAQEERTKFNVAENIRKAKSSVVQEQQALTNAAHNLHSFKFDTPNSIGDEIKFNSYRVLVTDRPESVNIGLREDKILYRTETYNEYYTTKRGEMRSRQKKRKVADKVKFTIAFPSRKRAVKGVMEFADYYQMTGLYNARHSQAENLAEFNRRYTAAQEKVSKDGEQIYFSPDEIKAIADNKKLAEFDLLLAEIGQEVLVEVDESEFSEFDQKLGLDLLSSNPNVDEAEGFLDGDSNNASDDGQVVEFKESDLKSMGLPTIRAQFGITARSYSEAFLKLQELGIVIHKS
jgi:hypothetical protein